MTLPLPSETGLCPRERPRRPRSASHLAGWMILSGSIFGQQAVQATTYDYLPTTTTGLWNTTTSWSPTGVPSVAGDVARMSKTDSATSITVTLTGTAVGVNTTRTIGHIDKEGTRGWTIAANNTNGVVSFVMDDGGVANVFGDTIASIVKNGTSSLSIAVPLVLGVNNANGLVITDNATNGTVTISGGITSAASAPNQTLYIASANGSNQSISLTTAAVNTNGDIVIGKLNSTNLQTGTGAILLSGGIGSNVKNIVSTSAGTVGLQGNIVNTGDITTTGSGAFTVNAAGAVINNLGNLLLNGSGNASLNASSSIVTRGNVTVSTSGAATSTFSGLVNNVGALVNNATSSGAVTFNGGIGSAVTSLTINGAGSTIIGAPAGQQVLVNGNILINNIGTNNGTNISAAINHNGTITNTSTSTGTVTLNGAIGSSVLGITQNSVNSPMTINGAVANTYTGGTVVEAGRLNVSKTGGVVGIGGNLTINGTSTVIFANSTGGQIADGAIVTVNGGGFNDSGVVNSGTTTYTDTFAELHVSGSGRFNAGNAVDGITVTGAATFEGGSGATGFMRDGSFFSANSLGLKNMTNTISTKAVDNANVADSFTVFGGNTSRLGVVKVGSGGLTLENSVLNLRRSATANSLGSTLILNGNVTTVGSSPTSIAEDTQNGATTLVGTTSIQLSDTGSGAVTRTFNIGANAPLTVNVAMNNGSAATAGIIKAGAGTLSFELANTINGAVKVNDGTLRVNAQGTVQNIFGSITSLEVSGAGAFELGFLPRVTDQQPIEGDRVNNSANVTLTNGGKFGFSGGNDGQVEVVSVLAVTGGGTIDLGVNSQSNLLQFDDFSSFTGTLAVQHYTGRVFSEDEEFSDATGSFDRIIFHALPSFTPAQFASIQFFGEDNQRMGNSSKFVDLFNSGFYEIVPILIIPEPSAFLTLLMGGAVLAGVRPRSRRRSVR